MRLPASEREPSSREVDPSSTEDELGVIAKVTSALFERQEVHQKRVELLLERHLERMNLLLSAGGDQGWERPEQPPTCPSTSLRHEMGPDEGPSGVGRCLERSATAGCFYDTTVPGPGPAPAEGEAAAAATAGGGCATAPEMQRATTNIRSSWMQRAGTRLGSLTNTFELEDSLSIRFVRTSKLWRELGDVAAHFRRGQLRSTAAVIVQSKVFECLFQAVIVASAVYQGLEQDWRAQHIGQALPGSYHYYNLAFTVLFFIEFFMRVLADFPAFFSCWNKEIRWNLFDTALMASAVADISLQASTENSTFDASIGRTLRLLRLVRVVRVFRVIRHFRALRVMVSSMLSSLKPLLFALALLFFVIYFTAVCILQFVSEERTSLSLLDGGRTPGHLKELDRYYGSLVRALYTLFLSVSGGISWGEACDPLLRVSTWLCAIFVMYIATCIFCTLNIITATFVEEAAAIAAADEENHTFYEIQKRKRFIGTVRKLFEAADKDGTGQMSWPDFQQLVKQVRMQTLLESLGIDVVSCGAQNLFALFALFDKDGSGSIDIEEFTAALTQMRGPARSADLTSLMHQHARMRDDVQAILESISGNALQSGAGRPPSAAPPPTLVEEPPRVSGRNVSVEV